jgi:hypothetical protein
MAPKHEVSAIDLEAVQPMADMYEFGFSADAQLTHKVFASVSGAKTIEEVGSDVLLPRIDASLLSEEARSDYSYFIENIHIHYSAAVVRGADKTTILRRGALDMLLMSLQEVSYGIIRHSYLPTLRSAAVECLRSKTSFIHEITSGSGSGTSGRNMYHKRRFVIGACGYANGDIKIGVFTIEGRLLMLAEAPQFPPVSYSNADIMAFLQNWTDFAFFRGIAMHLSCMSILSGEVPEPECSFDGSFDEWMKRHLKTKAAMMSDKEALLSLSHH